MKKLFLFILFFSFAFTQNFAQVDYSSAEGLYGDELQNALFELIKNHTRYPYTSSSTDTWDILKVADRDPNNPANIITIYMGYSLDAEGEYNAGWNREHVWAKSHGFPSSGDTAYTDCHHLHPADASTNSARGNKDFDNGGQEYYDGGTVPSGCYYTSISWEPRDAVKGDVARSMLYMATRYNSPALDLRLVENIPTSSNTPYFGKLSTLLAWNRFDPPDDWERRRNNVVESFQHNRNPFVDHPEFADRIYISDSLIIEYAEMIGPDKFIVKFSENADASTAEVAANYSLIGGQLGIESASLGYNGDNSIVKLTTTANIVDSMYIVRINNVQSVSGKKITKDAIAVFVFDSNINDVQDEILPEKFALKQNYPNPFNPTTTIMYSIPSVIARSTAMAGTQSVVKVALTVYNSLGRKIATLVNKAQPPGNYTVQFNAENLSSGIYFYSLATNGKTITKKMIFLK